MHKFTRFQKNLGNGSSQLDALYLMAGFLYSVNWTFLGQKDQEILGNSSKQMVCGLRHVSSCSTETQRRKSISHIMELL